MATQPLTAEKAGVEIGPIKRIALAVDGSPESARAIALTKELATAFGAEVTVFHFQEGEIAHSGQPAPGETSTEALTLVTKVVTELANAGLAVGADIEYSRPLGEAKPLARAAERFGAQLIVVGSRGLSTGRAWLQGSVSHDLIHATHVPIVIAR